MVYLPLCGIYKILSGRFFIHKTSKHTFSLLFKGYKWKKNRLSWKLTNYSPDMDYGAQRYKTLNYKKVWSTNSGRKNMIKVI